MTEQVFASLAKAIPVTDPDRAYDQVRWDISASSRIVEGRQDVTVAFSCVPVRVLRDGTVEEAGEKLRQHMSLSSVRDKNGQLNAIGKALASLAELLLAERERREQASQNSR